MAPNATSTVAPEPRATASSHQEGQVDAVPVAAAVRIEVGRSNRSVSSPWMPSLGWWWRWSRSLVG
jgi:hypothetical protein